MADETTTTLETGEATTAQATEDTTIPNTEDMVSKIYSAMFEKAEETTDDLDLDVAAGVDLDDDTSADDDGETVTISRAELERLQKSAKSDKQLKAAKAIGKIAQDFPNADLDEIKDMAKSGVPADKLFAEARRQERAYKKAEAKFAQAARPTIETAVKQAVESIYQNNGRPHTDVVKPDSDRIAELEAELTRATESGNNPLAIHLTNRIHEARMKKT